MSPAAETLKLRVKATTYEAQDINSYDLRLPAGGELPPFTAGAHVDLHLPNGLIRSYSLLNAEQERHRYVIAVNKDRASRGGSRYIHESLRVGDTLPVSLPRNNFPLALHASRSVLIAGGIGITPLLCMIRRLSVEGNDWQLHYGARTRQNAAFLEELKDLARACGSEARVHLSFDQETDAKMLDIASLVAGAADAHLYCCGPLPMLAAFEHATAALPSERVHVEYFAARERPAASGGFQVVLAKSGRTLTVPKGKTILDALLDADVAVQYSCMEGVCSSCETRVLEGIPDHRDLVLSKEERASNKVMMVCCSGSKTDRLVLDL
jgi:vanillate O-demethylase ferredoxin subunit